MRIMRAKVLLLVFLGLWKQGNGQQCYQPKLALATKTLVVSENSNCLKSPNSLDCNENLPYRHEYAGFVKGLTSSTQAVLSLQPNGNVQVVDELFSEKPKIGVTGNLSFVLAPFQYGMASFNASITSLSKNCSNITAIQLGIVLIVVGNVNQPPSFNVSMLKIDLFESSGLSILSIISNISAGAGEDGRQNVSFLVETLGDPLFAAPPTVSILDQSGNLYLRLVDGVAGTAVLLLRAHDDGGVLRGGTSTSAPVRMNVTAHQLNTPPSFALPAPSVTVPHDAGRVVVPGFATNISAGPPRDYCLGVPPPCVAQTVDLLVDDVDRPDLFALLPAIGRDGALSFAPLPAATGTAVVLVHAEDSGSDWPARANASAPRPFTVTVREAASDGGFLDFRLGRNLSCLTLADRAGCACPALTSPQGSLPVCAAAPAAAPAEVAVLAPLGGALEVDVAAFASGVTAARGSLPGGLAAFTAAGAGGGPPRFQELRQDALRAARGAEYARDAAASPDGAFGYAVDFETDALLTFSATGAPAAFTAVDRRVGGERRVRFVGFAGGPDAPFDAAPAPARAPSASDWRGFVAPDGGAFLAAGAGFVPLRRALPPPAAVSPARPLDFSRLWANTTALWTFDLDRCRAPSCARPTPRAAILPGA